MTGQIWEVLNTIQITDPDKNDVPDLQPICVVLQQVVWQDYGNLVEGSVSVEANWLQGQWEIAEQRAGDCDFEQGCHSLLTGGLILTNEGHLKFTETNANMLMIN